MKKILFLIMVILVGLQMQAQFSKATLQATGLTCAMCSNAINKALQKVSFVQTVHADIKNSSFDIVFKENEAINIDALKDAVEDAGFSVGSLTLTGNFNSIRIENDGHAKIGNDQFHFLNVNSKTLNGETTITVLDKDFVTEKAFKKYKAATRSIVENPRTASGERIYHVTI